LIEPERRHVVDVDFFIRLAAVDDLEAGFHR